LHFFYWGGVKGVFPSRLSLLDETDGGGGWKTQKNRFVKVETAASWVVGLCFGNNTDSKSRRGESTQNASNVPRKRERRYTRVAKKTRGGRGKTS